MRLFGNFLGNCLYNKSHLKTISAQTLANASNNNNSLQTPVEPLSPQSPSLQLPNGSQGSQGSTIPNITQPDNVPLSNQPNDSLNKNTNPVEQFKAQYSRPPLPQNSSYTYQSQPNLNQANNKVPTYSTPQQPQLPLTGQQEFGFDAVEFLQEESDRKKNIFLFVWRISDLLYF